MTKYFEKNFKKTRLYNMLANSAVGIIVTLLQVALNYVVRIVLVNELGPEINGLHNLFQSIVNVMTLMETGFSTALIIHLYKPVEFKDEKSIIEVMSFYKKIYTIIGISLLAIGLLIDVFIIDSIVTTTIPMVQVKIYFLIFVLSFALYYYTYYKKSILFADQKNRINTLAVFISEFIFRILEIIFAVAFHSYFIFLVLMILEKLCCNLICNIYINKNYPYLKKFTCVKVGKRIKRSVFKTFVPIFIYNISSTIQQSAKSILISYFLGDISFVGYFGNYQLVTNAAFLLYGQFGSAYTSAIGNLSVLGDNKKLYKFYRECSFWMNWCAILIASGIVACIQDFIILTFGKDYILPISCVAFLVVDMLVYLFSIPIISIQNAIGLHYLDKNVMIFQAIVSIILGFFGGKYYNIQGILFGLTLPQILFTLFYKGMIVNKKLFDLPFISYIKITLNDIIKSATTIYVCYFMCSLVSLPNIILDFLCKVILTIVICFLLCFLFSYKNKYFIDSLNKIVIYLKRGK